MTGLDLIKLAMIDIGAIYAGQTPNSTEQADGFTKLNWILSSWSRMGRHVYTHAVGKFVLQANVLEYTLGAGGTWNTAARPAGVQPGALAYYQNFQQGVQVMPMAQFEASIVNGQGVTAALPSRMGVDEAAPLRAVKVWPTPNMEANIDVPYWLPLTKLAAIGDTITFPVEGYEWALQLELSKALATSFGKPLPPEFVNNYQTAMARISDTNALIAAPPAPPAQQ